LRGRPAILALLTVLTAARAADPPADQAAALQLKKDGFAAYDRGDYAAAATALSRALAAFQRMDPGGRQASSCHYGLASVAEARGDGATAETEYRQALAGFEKLEPDNLGIALAAFGLGGVLRDKGDCAAAEPFLRRALTIYDKGEPSEMLANCLLNLGLTEMGLKQPAQAAPLFRRAAEVFGRAVPDGPDRATALGDWGWALRDLNDLDGAAEAYRQALAASPPGSRQAASMRVGAGSVAQMQGDLETAWQQLRAALAVYEQVAPGEMDLATCLSDLGNVSASRGDLDAAEAYHLRALAICQKLKPDSLKVAWVLNNLGAVAMDHTNLGAAYDYYSRALRLYGKLAPESADAASCLSNIGTVLRSLGRLDQARQCLEAALATNQKLAPDSLAVADTLNNLGNVADARGDYDQEQQFYRRALAIRLKLSPDSVDTAIIQNNLGQGLLAHGDAVGAVALMREAVALVEGRRGSLTGAEARALLTARAGHVYVGLARAELTAGDLAGAFATLEQARARGQVEALAERRADVTADAPPELLARQRDLDRRRLAAYRALNRLDPVSQAAQVVQARAEVKDLAAAQRDLELTLQQRSPRYAALRYPPPLDLPTAQGLLDDGTLLLSYMVDNERTWLFVITRQSARVAPVELGMSDLGAAVDKLRGGHAAGPRRRLSPLTAEAKRLYDLLVAPAAPELAAAKRVLLSPDGPLAVLPFAALVSGERDGAPRYFIEDLPLHQIGSMGLWRELRSRPPATAAGGDLVAFGDPAYRQDTADMVHGHALVDLPQSRAEVEALAALYGDHATVRLGSQATKSALRQLAPSAGVLHLACHGLLDAADPFDSALALAPEAGDDGLLTAYEILSLKLGARRVILSACQTGLGKLQHFEGVGGLSRAFQFAGADSVVVSLWSVSDRSTMRLMTELHRRLRAGEPTAEALRGAQLAMLAAGRAGQSEDDIPLDRPFAWAAFQLIGDWR
jgi:CHAT domain-containing protein/tetratricopeptide (TPR) repeat protein